MLAVTSPLATSIQATGITSFSDFAIGELATLTNWTGNVSTNWSNSSNWSSGVPTTNSIISIPAPLTNYPVLNTGTGSVQNITIQTGALLTVSTATLQISGTISNSGTFTASNGIIEMNGTSVQTIPAATFSGNTIKEIIVNNLAGVTLGGTLNLTGFLRVNAGQVNTGNFLVLKSSVTGTATVARITSIAADPINGDVTVERFIPGRRKYRLITSSVTTSPATTLIAGQESKSIWGNWQNGGNNISGIGSFITGGTVADGFDQQVIPASLFTYNPDTKKYVGYTSTNLKNTKLTPLKAGQAYYMYVFGDRINSVYAPVPNATVLNATGKLTTGDQTYTTSSAMPLNSTLGNFTLLGNPFASVIDWATISRTNLANTYWGWDPNLDNNGGYVTVNTTGAITLISPYTGTTGLTQYIQPGQGFFVKTTAASPVLNIREQDKVANTSNAAFRETGANNISLLAINLFYNKSGSQLFADGALAAFDESFVNEVAKEDASKMSGSGESVSIAEGAQLLSIDGRKLPKDTDTLRLNITRLTKPQYTLQIFAKQMEGGNLQAFVQDQYLKTALPLSLADTNKIVFNVTADSSSFSNNRFSIVFRQNSVLPVSFKTIDVVKKEKFANIKWSVATEEGIEKYEIERSSNGVDFKKLGEVVAMGNSTQIMSYTWLDIMPALGMNYYRIRSVSNDATIKISKIVNVFFEGAKSSIVVYPNPVVHQDINLQLNEIKQGRYTLILYSSNGMVVARFDFNHSGSTFQRIQIKTKIPAGAYYLKIEGPDFKGSQQVIFK